MPSLSQIRQHIETKRAKARHDAFVREQRFKIVEVLFRNIPRQENMKKRSQAIDESADVIVDLLYGTKEKAES